MRRGKKEKRNGGGEKKGQRQEGREGRREEKRKAKTNGTGDRGYMVGKGRLELKPRA